MQKGPLVTLSLLLVGLFVLPMSSSAASILDTTGALDFITYNSGSHSDPILGYVSSNNDYRTIGFRYKPGAQHNLCTVDVAVKRGGSAMLTNSIGMTIYKGNSSSASSTPLKYGTLVATSPNNYQVTATTTYEDLTFNLTPCLIVQGGTYYSLVFELSQTATTSSQQWSFEGNFSNATPAINQNTGTGMLFMGFDWYIGNSYNQTPFGNPNGSYSGNQMWASVVINGTENYSNFTASSTTTYSSTNCTPPGSILDVGGGVSYAFCYMFVPNTTLINQFSSLGNFLGERFPFSYVSEIQTEWNNYTYGTTTQMISVSLDLHDLGLGSTTPMGNLLPNWNVFSTSTILTYMSQSQLDVFRGMMTFVIWMGFFLYAYRRVIGLIST